MTITIEFYGRLKEQFSESPLTFHNKNNEVEAIYKALCQQYNQPTEQRIIKPIINDTFCEWQDTVYTGDVLGFLPPASGG